MSVSLNGSRGNSSALRTCAFWLSCSSRFFRSPASEKADTLTSPSLSSTLTATGFTISGVSTSSSVVGSGVMAAGFSSIETDTVSRVISGVCTIVSSTLTLIAGALSL
ncbi:hypothetical protein [Flavobacterium album]|uniref:hypothetical protein n=1 Tax=Flavobacterium album TaxID=2175091 RepID=UPI001FEBCFBF|nr:hypothetical protein [Flavobacterium album]